MRKILLGAVAIVLSANANATLVSLDWETDGDGLITLDTATGLEWLDLTVTEGLSKYDVLDLLFNDSRFKSWDYASLADWRNLATGNGISSSFINVGYRPELHEPITNIMSFLGATYITSNGSDAIHGLVGDIYNNTQSRRGDFYVSQDPNLGRAENLYTLENNAHNTGVGSYLVRVSSVPVPAAAWLFGSGLLGLVAVARRKPSH